MRIINISLVLFLVFCSFHASYQMAIVKGLGSFSERIQDCSTGETTHSPEATDVRHTKKPKTDSLNDVAKPQLPEDLKGPTSLSPITPKMKRCARTDTVGSRHNAPTLSLARRDVSAWRNRQCEICRSGSLCKKLDKCGHCSSICNNATTTTDAPVDNNVNPITPEAQKREITANDQQDNVVLGSRFRATEEDVNRPRYYSLGSVEPGSLMRLFAKIFNIPDNFEKLLILGKMKGSDDDKDAGDIVIIDLAQVFRNEKKIHARVQKVDNNGAQINMDLIEKLDKDLENAIMNKLGQSGNTQLSKDEITGFVDDAMKEGNDNVGSSHTTTAPETQTRCDLEESIEDLLDIKPKKEHKHEEPYPEHRPQPPKPHGIYHHPEESKEHKYEEHYPEHKPEPPKPYGVNIHPESLEESSEEEFSNPPVIQDSYVVGDKQLENEYVDDNGEIKPETVPEVVGKNIDEGYVDDNEEARPSVISEFKVPKSKPALQEASKPHVPKETQTVGEPQRVEIMSVPEEAKSVPSSRNQINEPNLQGTANGDVEDPSHNLQDNVAKVVEDSLKLVPGEENPLQNLVDQGTLREEEPNLQERMNEPNSGNPLKDLEKNVVAIVEDSLKAVPNRQNLLQSTGQDPSGNNQVSEPNPEWGRNGDLVKEPQRKMPSEDLSKNVEDSDKPGDNFVRDEWVRNGDLVREPQRKMPSEDLTKDIFKIVEDLETPEDNFVGDETPQEIQQDSQQPSQANADNTVQEFEAPPAVAAEIANRGQKIDSASSEEASSSFGALVPAKNTPPNLDPRIKNIFYVGDNINLPLKMIQDENGVIKLRVDTDALCNCKNQNCTKKHVGDEFKSKVRESEVEETDLPKLEVRFGTESHNGEDLLNSFVNDLHQNGEVSGIFKRSPEANFDDVVDDEENELENEIKKLDESIETYNRANEDLLNEGTMALYKDVQKSKSVERMVTLASNLLSWMKQVAADRKRE